jgi:two-component system response regulator RegA
MEAVRRDTDRPGSSVRRCILLVDDESVFRERLARALRRRGLVVETSGSPGKALERLHRGQRFDYAVLDLRMPGISGLELLSAVKRIDAAMRVVILTSYGSIASTVEAMRLGAWSCVAKPTDADELLNVLQGDDPRATTSLEPAERGSPTLARAEWEHIQRVLADCDGNKSHTAHRLAISRRSLQLKLKKRAPRR